MIESELMAVREEGLYQISPHGFSCSPRALRTSLIVLSPELISVMSRLLCASSDSCSSGMEFRLNSPVSCKLNLRKNCTSKICSKFLRSGMSVKFQNARCWLSVSVPLKELLESYIFATLGGIPYLARRVYRFHDFMS